MTPTLRRLGVAVAAAALLVLTACSSSDSDNEAGPSESGAPVTSTDGAFPVTLEHKFGSTTIESEPQRVVSVGFHEQDWLYALGVAPVAVREWYNGYDYATWPWADEARIAVGAEPEVLPGGEINIEQVAALEPDLIVATWSGITQEQYDLLSQIAPVVAQGGEWEDYGMPFEEETRMIAKALGKVDEGEKLISDLEARFEAVRTEHPEWEGKTAAVGFVYEGQPGVYFSYDPRAAFLGRLGLDVTAPDSIGDPSTDFFLTVSPERLDLLDFDTIVWLTALSPDTRSLVEAIPSYPNLNITKTGGHVWSTDAVFEGAFSFASPLSQAYVLDTVVPQLEAALDGDPATEVPGNEAAA